MCSMLKIHRILISHFKAPLSAFLGSGVNISPKGIKSILGRNRGVLEGVCSFCHPRANFKAAEMMKTYTVTKKRADFQIYLSIFE